MKTIIAVTWALSVPFQLMLITNVMTHGLVTMKDLLSDALVWKMNICYWLLAIVFIILAKKNKII